jgi:hypothetical protein
MKRAFPTVGWSEFSVFVLTRNRSSIKVDLFAEERGQRDGAQIGRQRGPSGGDPFHGHFEEVGVRCRRTGPTELQHHEDQSRRGI